MANNNQKHEEKKSLGTENSTGSQVSKVSGYEKALAENPSLKKKKGNPFAADNPDASKTPGGASEAKGKGTSSRT